MIISDLSYLEPVTEAEISGSKKLVDIDLDLILVNVVQIAVPIAIAVGINLGDFKRKW